MTVRVTGVKLNRSGMRDLLRSEGVQAMLGRRAERVADVVRSAGIRVEGVPGKTELPVEVDIRAGKNRARATVAIDHPAGLAVEAKHGVLTASIDAAKSV